MTELEIEWWTNSDKVHHYHCMKTRLSISFNSITIRQFPQRFNHYFHSHILILPQSMCELRVELDGNGYMCPCGIEILNGKLMKIVRFHLTCSSQGCEKRAHVFPVLRPTPLRLTHRSGKHTHYTKCWAVCMCVSWAYQDIKQCVFAHHKTLGGCIGGGCAELVH